MTLQVIDSEQVQKDVTFLQDVKVKYVSLVRHGANREPFKIMKRDGGTMDHVIQSVVIPKGKSLSDFCAEEGLTWLNSVKTDTAVEKESYTEYEQAPKSKFESLSEPQPLGASGVSIIFGLLKDKKEKADLITAPASLMDQPMVTEQIPIKWSAAELLYQQTDALMDTIGGVTSQTGLSKDERTNTIVTAGKAYFAFLEEWASKLGDAPTGMKLQKKYSTKTEGGQDDMTKEEFQELMQPYTEKQDKLAEAIDALAKKMQDAPAAAEPPVVTEPPAATGTEDLDAIKAELAELKKFKEEHEAKDAHALVTEPKATKQDGVTAPVEKTETYPNGAPKEKREGIFKGLIFNTKKMADAGLA